mgnify:FL=1
MHIRMYLLYRYHYTESLLFYFHDSTASVLEAARRHRSSSDQQVPPQLLIVFRDRRAVDSLGPFGRMMTVLLLSGGHFDQVILGYAPRVSVAPSGTSRHGSTGTMAVLHGFVREFAVDLRTQSEEDLYVVDAAHVAIQSQSHAASRGAGTTVQMGRGLRICVGVVAHVDWSEGFGKRHWFTDLQNLTHIQTATDRVCRCHSSGSGTGQGVMGSSLGGDSHGGSHLQRVDIQLTGAPMEPDDIELGKRKWQRRATKTLPELDTYAHPQRADTPAHPLRVLLYQRDKSRRLIDADVVMEELERKLNGASGSADTAPTSRLGKPWIVESVVHDEHASPCLLVDRIGKTDVLITPHGFQSTLLLFQPVRSVLVEVFPFWYDKPFVFGSIQVSLRLLGLHHRSYLFEESKWKSTMLALIEGFMPMFTRRNCIRYYTDTCGWLSKLQDVRMSPEFVTRVSNFLSIQFNTR